MAPSMPRWFCHRGRPAQVADDASLARAQRLAGGVGGGEHSTSEASFDAHRLVPSFAIPHARSVVGGGFPFAGKPPSPRHPYRGHPRVAEPRRRACVFRPPTITCGLSLDDLLRRPLPVEAENEERLAAEAESTPTPPTVYLVGTGPGDAGMLTLRAVELMRRADVVLYDRLVSEEILKYVGAGATMVYVGKERGLHTRSQEEIHALLRRFAHGRPGGKTVVRLKGGDPFVFGRGGEEVQYLRAQGVPVHVVPGVTAAAGIGAELLVPLTHRGVAHSVRFLTGHVREGAEVDVGDVHDGTTLVVYMGLAALRSLLDTLTARGLCDNMPTVAVERGTTSEQRVVWARAADLVERVEEAALQSPSLVIVGNVVALAPGYMRAVETGEWLCESGAAAPVMM